MKSNISAAANGFFCLFFFYWNSLHSRLNVATMRHVVTRKRSTERLKDTGNLFRKNLYTVKRCLLILDLKPFRS